MFVAKEIMLENKFIVSRMKKAYMDDIECMMQQTPALNRIHLLPRVISVLKRFLSSLHFSSCCCSVSSVSFLREYSFIFSFLFLFSHVILVD